MKINKNKSMHVFQLNFIYICSVKKKQLQRIVYLIWDIEIFNIFVEK